MNKIAAALALMVGLVPPVLAQEQSQATPSGTEQGGITRAHAIAIHGDVKHGPDFRHFDWVNPDAPKGGEVRTAAAGTFDSFNPYITTGSPVSYGAESLMVGNPDEDASAYCLICETIEFPEDRSWVAFNLRPEARWHDGQPITADDVIFSFNILVQEGAPIYRQYWSNVAEAVKEGDRRVVFRMKQPGNHEMPNIMGDLPVLAKHWWEERNFTEPSLDIPVTSGPYRIASFEAGRTIRRERVPDYWGADLPVNVGRNNVGVLVTEFFRDRTVAREAFKGGQVDFWSENVAKEWAEGYNIPAVEQGLIKKELIPHQIPQGMQGLWFNTRREKFSDPRVRQALTHLMDFEWMNRTLFFDQYTRSRSFFTNTELAASGLPEGEELEFLEPFRGRVPEDVFTTEYNPPTSPGTGDLRDNMRKAIELLGQAGYELREGRLVNAQTGEQFSIEILGQATDPSLERVVLPYIENLRRIGVAANLRTVDDAQYQNLVRDFEFDMIMDTVAQSLSPGNEQREYWGSEAAEQPGSSNIAGVRDPVVDEIIEQIVVAPDRETLVHRVRALDRVLQWGHYVVPQWYLSSFRVLYWDKFGRPEREPKYGLGFPTSWWIDPAKAEAIASRQRSTNQ